MSAPPPPPPCGAVGRGQGLRQRQQQAFTEFSEVGCSKKKLSPCGQHLTCHLAVRPPADSDFTQKLEASCQNTVLPFHTGLTKAKAISQSQGPPVCQL
ncbi:uncharacterized protein RHO17_024377 isoform 2-T4 [Thomomys bottae]